MKTWVLFPFSRIAGWPALGLGCAMLLTTAITGWAWRGVYTDGVLDLHVAAEAPLPLFVLLGLIAWLSMATVALGVGHWLSATRYRAIDLIGTQALARWPMLPAAILIGIPSYRDKLEQASTQILQSSEQVGAAITLDLAPHLATVLALSTLPMLALIWMIWLMYHSYSLVFNLHGARSVWSFIGVLTAAEVLSKVAIAGVVLGWS